jgi:hypothetical protein
MKYLKKILKLYWVGIVLISTAPYLATKKITLTILDE